MTDMLSDIETMAQTDAPRAWRELMVWLSQFCVAAPDGLFALACNLRDRLSRELEG